MAQYCYFNGKILPFEEAHIAPNDLGVIRGYGVFDFLRTYNGKPLLLERNLKRFRNSAQVVGLTLPYTDAEITKAISDLMTQNQISEAVFRLVLTGGVSEDNISAGTNPTFYILISPFVPMPKEYYENGITLMSHEHLRLFPEAKTLNYVTAVKLQSEKKARGAVEILYTYQGMILECATSNFYLIKDNVLVTPNVDILNGITRGVVLELAQKIMRVEERPVRFDKLKAADEAFITAANKGILPVVRVDSLKIGSGAVGPKTKQLMQVFQEFTTSQ